MQRLYWARIFGKMLKGGINVRTLIGLERERNDKPAGLRTCMLVCLGTTMFTIITLLLNKFGQSYDLSRIPAYTIAGIGFLGSGVIILRKGKAEGITTAGVLWGLVGIGILIGIGEFILASICTLCVFGILMLKYVEVKIRGNK